MLDVCRLDFDYPVRSDSRIRSQGEPACVRQNPYLFAVLSWLRISEWPLGRDTEFLELRKTESC